MANLEFNKRNEINKIMKELKVETTIEVYDKPSELAPKDKELLKAAKSALKNSYSPYSKFKVAASIRFNNGEILTGSNQENASYPLCLCAERVVLSAADSLHPKRKIESMAITIKSGKRKIKVPVSPCGACRQAIAESEYKLKQAMRIILQGEGGQIFILKSGMDLLPLSFDGSFLD